MSEKKDTAQRHPLDAIFKPKSVALIGATDRPASLGRTTLWNLISSPFGGAVYPINPKRSNVLGIQAYPSLKACPEAPDMAVILTPAPTVPGLITECVEAGVNGVIIISAGFKEVGPAGVKLEQQIMENAQGKLRIIGPNCLGILSPLCGLNASFARRMARKGNVAFLSQSGALGTAALDWSFDHNVGFSAFASVGSMLDIGWGDMIMYLGDDPSTESIVIYMESIGNAQSFLSAAREVALTKPIIVIKPGRTEGAAKAAASHTGSLTGSDDVLDAAFRRCGVLRIDDISDLFNVAELLAKQPRPRGNRLTIVTNAGGPGVLATDALISSGGQLADIAKETIDALNPHMPSAWSHGNPVDVLGDAGPDRYAKALEIVANDPNSDGMLVILTPQSVTETTATAELLRPYAKIKGKPVLASWMGGPDVAEGAAILNESGIPAFPYPDAAARMFTYMWKYSANLNRLYEVPEAHSGAESDTIDRNKVDGLINTARKENRTLLTELESKQLLAAYGIATTDTRLAKSETEAVKLAEAIGFPVVLKLYSLTITHKTDVGGVVLNLQNADDVRRAFRQIESAVKEKAGAQHFQGVTVQPMVKLDGYEIILGSSIDPQFGPVMLFGMGGQLVEVFKDRALALPPLTTWLARQMMERTKIYTALKGVRGRKGVDMAVLENLVVRFSQLIVEQKRIKEIDINPLLAGPDKVVALDARVVLHDNSVSDDQLPSAAIRPYPVKYSAPWKLKDSTPVTIRPIRPEDEGLMVKFHESLSQQTVRLRYLYDIPLDQRIAHARLTRVCFIDYEREMALVVERKDPASGQRQIVAVGRMRKQHGTSTADIFIVIADAFQKKGLGHELLHRMIDIAKQEKINCLVANMAPESKGMLKLCEDHGFSVKRNGPDAPMRGELKL